MARANCTILLITVQRRSLHLRIPQMDQSVHACSRRATSASYRVSSIASPHNLEIESKTSPLIRLSRELVLYTAPLRQLLLKTIQLVVVQRRWVLIEKSPHTGRFPGAWFCLLVQKERNRTGIRQQLHPRSASRFLG